MCDDKCKRPSSAQAHCARCHNTWSTVGQFDGHRKNGRCQEPSLKGSLVEHRGVWGTPEGHAKQDASIERLRQHREGK